MKKNGAIIGGIAGFVGVILSRFFREAYGDDTTTIIVKISNNNNY